MSDLSRRAQSQAPSACLVPNAVSFQQPDRAFGTGGNSSRSSLRRVVSAMRSNEFVTRQGGKELGY
ncbi:hypothetical protein SAMN05444161_4004 [Rhizobiales bacterium GAS191]|nr:hypothetical protein SAMN05444161_4004 [Rhizobiales bacterium GAS191]